MIGYEGLNPEQKRCVDTKEGPVLVLAGAGSGKTGALTVRMASLLEAGVAPWKILAITFTNKAAAEMRERVHSMAGSGARDMWIMTFHAACVRILRRDIDKLGYTRDFSIYDSSDSEHLIKECFKELKYSLTDKTLSPKSALAAISSAKEELISWEDFESQTGGDPRRQKISALYRLYRERLKRANALDFDDIIYRTVQLFKEQPAVLEYYQNRFQYIMVDEYQDTNTSQYELLRLLADKHKNLCVVGDDDQSIYGWRGANIRNILEFEQDYPGCAVIRLEQNYRSTGNILEAANSVIKNNMKRKGKKLWTTAPKGGIITLVRADNEYDEAHYIVRTIEKKHSEGAPLSNFAILYRTNAQSRVPEEQLASANISYKLFGGVRFYERREIKDVLAYIKLIVNPSDDVSLARVINVPKRGIGDATLTRIREAASEKGVCSYELMPSAGALPGVGSRAAKLREFHALIESLKKEAEGSLPSEFIETMCKRTGYYALLESEGEEGIYRRENIAELISKAAHREKEEPGLTLGEFLEEVAL
ncbi:MAG: UvrD-helicase domain-containing protein, partial [Firmicutes bacterium]|nr:UvrD-helicase domain-containing protein [Bacillota bacterium]